MDDELRIVAWMMSILRLKILNWQNVSSMILGTLITSITVIQECVDEVTEEQYMIMQQRRWFDDTTT